MERLTRDSLRATDEADRARSAFKADADAPDAFRVHPSQFLKSGYDKGHLAPARTLPLVPWRCSIAGLAGF